MKRVESAVWAWLADEVEREIEEEEQNEIAGGKTMKSDQGLAGALTSIDKDKSDRELVNALVSAAYCIGISRSGDSDRDKQLHQGATTTCNELSAQVMQRLIERDEKIKRLEAARKWLEDYYGDRE